MRSAEGKHGLRAIRIERFIDHYTRRLVELEACFGEGERLMAVVREQLNGVSR